MAKTIVAMMIVVVMAIAGYWLYQTRLAPKEKEVLPESKKCLTDDDCLVFGKDGDCNCGCFNKNYQWEREEGNCLCAAPTSCQCLNGRCEEGFEE